jgi:hypothetical protein
MEQTIELRMVDPKTLTYVDKRDPRQVPADRLSDAALKANSNAIGFVQPPLFSEERTGPSPSSRAGAASRAPSPTSLRKWRFSSNRPIRSTICAPSPKTSCARRCRPSISGEQLKISPRRTGRRKRSRQPSPCRSDRSASSGSSAASIPRCSSTWGAATCLRSDTSARSPPRLSPNRPPRGQSRSRRRARRLPGTRSPILS